MSYNKAMRLKQGGFSLVELVVGGAILAGVGLLGTQLVKNQKVQQQRIDHDLELELLHSKISDFFRENAKDCDATFRYHYNQVGPIPAPAAIRRCTTNCEAWRDAQLTVGPVVFAVNSGLGDRTLWQVESFGELINQAGLSPSRSNIMLLPVNYVHRTQSSRRLTKFVPITMRFDSGGRFKQCLDSDATNIQNLERAACHSFTAISTSGSYVKATWNGDTQTCTTTLVHPNGDCPTGVYYNGVLKGRAVRCARFRDDVLSPPVFNAGSAPDLFSVHQDYCSFNIPGAPQSYPRIYTDSNNRFIIRCGP